MTSKEYIAGRLALRKAAAGPLSTVLGGIKSLFGSAAGVAKDVARFGLNESAKATKLAIPTLGLLGTWLAYKSISPKAVADLAPEFAVHAIERESLLQSLRDLEGAELDAQIKKGKRRAHDQFL